MSSKSKSGNSVSNSSDQQRPLIVIQLTSDVFRGNVLERGRIFDFTIAPRGYGTQEAKGSVDLS